MHCLPRALLSRTSLLVFSGSRKSVLPGIASYKTIMYNHNGQFVNDSHSRAGNLCHNHVSEDMFAAAEDGPPRLCA